MKSQQKKTAGTKIDRRRFLKVVGGTAAAVALAPPRKASAQPKGLTLRAIIHLYPPTGAVQGLLPAYEKESGIKVVFDQIPFGEGYAKQMAELATGGARYDMLTPWSFWSNGEIGTGQLEVLDDYVAKAGPALDWNDIIPVQRDLFKYAGHQYGVPISSQTFLLAYRHDIYSAAGLTPPRDGVLTSDAFAADVKKLHKFQKDVYGMVWHHKPVAAAAMSWAIMFNAAGGRWFDEKLNPLFNSPTAVLVTEYYTKEIIPYMPPDVLTYGNTERDETYQRGLAVHQIPPLSRIPAIFDPQRSKVQDKTTFVTVPFKGLNGTKYERSPAVDEGWAFVINKNSKNKKEAFDFIVWASTKEKQKRMALESAIAPNRASVLADKDVRAKHGWLVVAERQFKANLPESQFPKIPEWGEIMEKHGNELHIAYARQASVKEALDRSNAAVVALLKERGYKVGTHTGKMPWE